MFHQCAPDWSLAYEDTPKNLDFVEHSPCALKQQSTPGPGTRSKDPVACRPRAGSATPTNQSTVSTPAGAFCWGKSWKDWNFRYTC